MFEVILSPDARDFYAGAERHLARRLARCFEQLESEPRRHNNIRRLSGALEGYFRYRVGDWRVIYRVDDAAEQVSVVAIAHRREAYE
jgi:mRNA interferase RelE/StbE